METTHSELSESVDEPRVTVQPTASPSVRGGTGHGKAIFGSPSSCTQSRSNNNVMWVNCTVGWLIIRSETIASTYISSASSVADAGALDVEGRPNVSWDFDLQHVRIAV